MGWLRLIFVGFHVGVEWIRGVSQKDLIGLLCHSAAFFTGFGYVLYFLPPMGDGTLLPADRPYVVPCAYSSWSHGWVPEEASMRRCVRIFSQFQEYEVSTLHSRLLLLFVGAVTYTVFHV